MYKPNLQEKCMDVGITQLGRAWESEEESCTQRR